MMLRPPNNRRYIAALTLATALAALLTGSGCVKRRLTIRSNPPGARVFVDRQEIGVTPVSTSFTYYAPRRIELVKEGYETLNVLHSVDAPWYEYPPLDFFSENFAGREIRDERVVDFQLIPQQMVPNNVLLERAQALRNQSLQGHIVPLITPPPAPPPANQPPPPPFAFPPP
ncbi:MAG: PEGA domain-containing protein [Pirellulales bacterium]